MSAKNRDLQYYINKKVQTCHYWGDDWFKENGKDLCNAIDYIGDRLHKCRVFVYDKEKYGTYRCSLLGMYDGTIRWLLGKYSVRVENHWYDKVDRFLAKVKTRLGIVSLVRRWQRYRVNVIFQDACKRWPHLVNELISEIDLYTWVKPCRRGIVDGEEIFNKYWITVK